MNACNIERAKRCVLAHSLITYRVLFPQWSGGCFGLAIIISYLILFIRLYNEKYSADQAAASKKLRSSAPSTIASVVPPTPEFASTFSPHAKTRSLAGGSAENAPVISFALATNAPEDQFAGLRSKWLAHPILVADRVRWNEHEKLHPISMMPDHSHEHESVSPQSKLPASTLNRRFGTNSARL